MPQGNLNFRVFTLAWGGISGESRHILQTCNRNIFCFYRSHDTFISGNLLPEPWCSRNHKKRKIMDHHFLQIPHMWPLPHIKCVLDFRWVVLKFSTDIYTLLWVTVMILNRKGAKPKAWPKLWCHCQSSSYTLMDLSFSSLTDSTTFGSQLAGHQPAYCSTKRCFQV